ncbi:hypothetical protein OHB12_06185 [Nocardia sp. NBC_01730]|uniref:hypothetical protein n=1 Tax=Nocardia sp. NBC_01730 TaxID=2975998 RepID=UPI002E13488C|nr:hypothetical protein OHB12_06185 [Nocardia sp. NBC_01730]
MRLWRPELGRYSEHAQQLTKRLPPQPAALPLYVRRRTRLLGLDFDAKHHSADKVERDVHQCLAWIRECGGRAITDRSTSGGRHILVPLPIGTALTKSEVEPIMRLLAERLATLDITPMFNDVTGSLTPPGSRCKEGGYRQLDGSLDAAANTLIARSTPGFVARLVELLGAAHITPTTARTTPGARASRVTRTSAPCASTPDRTHLWEGSGDRARLRTEYRRRTPMPATVTTFAVHGLTPDDQRWRARDGRLDRSAARQAVLAAAAMQGMSFTDIQAQLPSAGGSWAGLAQAYTRYGHGADTALRRDWDHACRWASTNAPEFLPLGHKKQEHTGGCRGEHRFHAKTQTRWLATATHWIDAQWPHSPRRSNALAVLQALAYASVVGGHVVKGVPVVELGGRSLSIMAGCMPETTLWQVLRDIRDLPGAPLLRVRRGTGLLADRYALVTPRLSRRPDPVQSNQAQVEPVHQAWSVLGIHRRRLYEVIVHHGLTTPADALSAARMSRSAGYCALAALSTTGLISHTRGLVERGPVSLDDIARAHGLQQAHTERIARHRHERAAWTTWLATRFGAPHPTRPTDDHRVPAEPWHRRDTEDYLVSVLAAGPPDRPPSNPTTRPPTRSECTAPAATGLRAPTGPNGDPTSPGARSDRSAEFHQQ